MNALELLAKIKLDSSSFTKGLGNVMSSAAKVTTDA